MTTSDEPSSKEESKGTSDKDMTKLDTSSSVFWMKFWNDNWTNLYVEPY